MSWNNGSSSQKTKNSKKRFTRKIQRIISTDERWKAEAAQDEDSDDTLKDSSTGEEFFVSFRLSGWLKFQVKRFKI